MPTSTLTSRGQTTVPKEIREGSRKVAVTTERPAFWRWEASIKTGRGDVVADVAKGRKLRTRQSRSGNKKGRGSRPSPRSS